MSKWFYSGNGDQGFTSLIDGHRISKGDDVFELIGSLDEVNAQIGMAISFCTGAEIREDLRKIQNDISSLMAIIAGIEKSGIEYRSSQTQSKEWLEKRIEFYGKSVNNPQGFIFSGNTTLGAALDLARTAIRRSERMAVRITGFENDDKNVSLSYLNRLSSFFYILRLFADESAH
jgi:cob(I)alamin adenosyltransferase